MPTYVRMTYPSFVATDHIRSASGRVLGRPISSILRRRFTALDVQAFAAARLRHPQVG